MKHVYALLIMLWALTSIAIADGPVVKIRVMQQGVCMLGKDCEPVSVACGSAVVIDIAQSQKGLKGYAILTAAHVVSTNRQYKEKGILHWLIYPTDHFYEILIGGEWRRAYLKATSKHADLALLTVGCAKDVDIVCIADSRPKPNEELQVQGYTQCNELDVYSANVYYWDEGTECLDGFKNAQKRVVVGQSGGAVLDSKGDLVGILVGYPQEGDRFGLYTNHSEILRFVKASWRDLGPKPEINSKAPGIDSEPLPKVDVPNVFQGIVKPPETKPSDLGGLWDGLDEEIKTTPKINIKPLEESLPPAPKVTLPNFPRPPNVGGMMDKADKVLDKAEPWAKIAGVALTGLEVAGVVGTGGAGAVAVGALGAFFSLRKKLKDKDSSPQVPVKDKPVSCFPGQREHGSWYGYGDTTVPPNPPPNPPPTPVERQDQPPAWLEEFLNRTQAPPQITVQPAPVTVVNAPCMEPSQPGGAGDIDPPRANLPLPRDMDETRQLLELLQANGSVPALEALAGSLYKAEIEKLLHEGVSPEAEKTLSGLVSTVLQRVNEIAPISTKG